MAESNDKLLVVVCEPCDQIRAVDAAAYKHASNALAYLDGGGQVIFAAGSQPDEDDVAAEIQKVIGARGQGVAPESTFADVFEPIEEDDL